MILVILAAKAGVGVDIAHGWLWARRRSSIQAKLISSGLVLGVWVLVAPLELQTSCLSHQAGARSLEAGSQRQGSLKWSLDGRP